MPKILEAGEVVKNFERLPRAATALRGYKYGKAANYCLYAGMVGASPQDIVNNAVTFDVTIAPNTINNTRSHVAEIFAELEIAPEPYRKKPGLKIAAETSISGSALWWHMQFGSTPGVAIGQAVVTDYILHGRLSGAPEDGMCLSAVGLEDALVELWKESRNHSNVFAKFSQEALVRFAHVQGRIGRDTLVLAQLSDGLPVLEDLGEPKEPSPAEEVANFGSQYEGLADFVDYIFYAGDFDDWNAVSDPASRTTLYEMRDLIIKHRDKAAASRFGVAVDGTDIEPIKGYSRW
jgi:hypothetical protein